MEINIIIDDEQKEQRNNINRGGIIELTNTSKQELYTRSEVISKLNELFDFTNKSVPEQKWEDDLQNERWISVKKSLKHLSIRKTNELTRNVF